MLPSENRCYNSINHHPTPIPLQATLSCSFGEDLQVFGEVIHFICIFFLMYYSAAFGISECNKSIECTTHACTHAPTKIKLQLAQNGPFIYACSMCKIQSSGTRPHLCQASPIRWLCTNCASSSSLSALPTAPDPGALSLR